MFLRSKKSNIFDIAFTAAQNLQDLSYSTMGGYLQNKCIALTSLIEWPSVYDVLSRTMSFGLPVSKV